MLPTDQKMARRDQLSPENEYQLGQEMENFVMRLSKAFEKSKTPTPCLPSSRDRHPDDLFSLLSDRRVL